MDAPRSSVSPSKFATLPEDLQARIIRRGVGATSKREQELTIADRIHDASTKPFSKEEIKWLIKVRRSITFFLDSSRVGLASVKVVTIPFGGAIPKILDELEVNIEDSTAEFNRESATHTFAEQQIVAWLTDVLDHTKSYVVWVDIRTIFLVLHRRFKLVLPDRALLLAREWTLQILNNIVDSYQGTLLPYLLTYLLYNASQFDLIADIAEYIGEDEVSTVDINADYLQLAQEQCTELYQKLVNVINCMC